MLAAGLVIGAAHLGGLALALSLFRSTSGGAFKGRCLCWSAPLWAPVELLLGLALLFTLGSGFYLGPACIVAAACLRFLELRQQRVHRMLPDGRAADADAEGSVNVNASTDLAVTLKIADMPLLPLRPGAVLTEDEALVLNEQYAKDTACGASIVGS